MIDLTTIKNSIVEHFRHISTETIGWLAVVCVHCATIPPIVGLLLGVSERLPSMDVVAFMWTGLVLFFIKSLITRDMLNIITIGVGFIIQAGLLALLVFK
jgi:hypothetical protein